MSLGWSVFVVPVTPAVALANACRGIAGTPKDGVLVVGASIEGHTPFLIEHHDGRYWTPMDDSDGVYSAQLCHALKSPLWMMYGDSNTDSMDLSQFERGQCVAQRADPVDGDAPFSIDALRHWATFGISGAESNGDRVKLY